MTAQKKTFFFRTYLQLKELTIGKKNLLRDFDPATKVNHLMELSLVVMVLQKSQPKKSAKTEKLLFFKFLSEKTWSENCWSRIKI